MLLHAMDDSEDCDEKESSPIPCAFDVSSAELLRALDATDNDIHFALDKTLVDILNAFDETDSESDKTLSVDDEELLRMELLRDDADLMTAYFNTNNSDEELSIDESTSTNIENCLSCDHETLFAQHCKTSSTTDTELAEKAMSDHSYAFFSKFKCPCGCRSCCKDEVSTGALRTLKNKVFMDQPSEDLRRERYYAALKEAWNRIPGSNTFVFYIGTTRVCERTYRVALGMHKDPSRMWKIVRTCVRMGYDPCIAVKQKRVPTDGTKSRVKDHIIGWIMHFARKRCDQLPVNDLCDDILYVVPFISTTDFAREFFQENPDIKCSTMTFRRAFLACTTVRLMRCKGNFSKCAVCQTAADMLANTNKKLTKSGREV